MSFIEWTDKNKVNVREVDEQHQRLFAMLNELHEATVGGQEQSALKAIFDDLIDYTVYHFQTEERLYQEYGCPNYEAHKAEHDALTAQAVALQQQFQEGSATVSFELLVFLNDWLTEHTIGLDRQVGPCLNAQGVF